MTKSNKSKITLIATISIVIVLAVAFGLSSVSNKAIKQQPTAGVQNAPVSNTGQLPKGNQRSPNHQIKNTSTTGNANGQEAANKDDQQVTDPRYEAIEISDYVKEKLTDLMMEPAKAVPVNRKLAAEDRKNFRKFVAASMDLDEAEKHINTRFTRVNYLQELEDGDIIRTLSEEIGPDGEIIGGNLHGDDPSQSKSKGPVKLHYCEGPNYLEFEREKEEVEITNPASREEAVEMVSSYVQNMNLLTETYKDRIRSKDTDTTNISTEIAGTEGEETNYIVQQSVNLRREYEGTPVINSSVRISFNPETNEVIQVAKRHWPPLAEEGEITVKKESSAEEAGQLSTNVQGEVINTIAQNASVEYNKAEVTDVNKVYFQTQEGLKLLLYFEVNYNYQTGENGTETQPGAVLINAYEKSNP